MIIKSILLVALIVLLMNCALAQENNHERKDKESKISNVFGCPAIVCLGTDTLKIDSNLKVIYSLKDCNFVGVDSLGSIIWEKDISKFGCDLVAFRLMSANGMKKVKGCDVIFQTEDKAVYGLKSKRGQTKRLDINEIFNKPKN